jgi:hypothetical protein
MIRRMNKKGCRRKRQWPELRQYPDPDGLRKTTRPLRQKIRFPGRDMSARALPSGPRDLFGMPSIRPEIRIHDLLTSNFESYRKFEGRVKDLLSIKFKAADNKFVSRVRVKLTTHMHLVPKSRMVELYLHSFIRLRGIALN